jgi:WhiB family transcriptional regulator, redox-sensing transcriptional regulator
MRRILPHRPPDMAILAAKSAPTTSPQSTATYYTIENFSLTLSSTEHFSATLSVIHHTCAAAENPTTGSGDAARSGGSAMTAPDTHPVSGFTIPADPTDADHLAGELGELATACEWKRAAIVYARVQVSEHGGDRSKLKSDLANGKMTPAEYAVLGIHGLRSPQTVRRYWRAWQRAVDEGLAEPVKLGDTVELPTAEWGDFYAPMRPLPDTNTTDQPDEIPQPDHAASITVDQSEPDQPSVGLPNIEGIATTGIDDKDFAAPRGNGLPQKQSDTQGQETRTDRQRDAALHLRAAFDNDLAAFHRDGKQLIADLDKLGAARTLCANRLRAVLTQIQEAVEKTLQNSHTPAADDERCAEARLTELRLPPGARLFHTSQPTPCTTNPDLFDNPRRRTEAAAQCSSCHFQGRCSYNALATGATHGIWGGIKLPGNYPKQLPPIYAKLRDQFERRRHIEPGAGSVALPPLAQEPLHTVNAS